LFKLHAAKVATPDEAAVVVAVHSSLLPPPLVAAKLTFDVSVVTTFPPASSIETTGCVAKAVPPVAFPEGGVVKTSTFETPVDTVTKVVAEVSPVAVAVIV
jgi:hypothetical protein